MTLIPHHLGLIVVWHPFIYIYCLLLLFFLYFSYSSITLDWLKKLLHISVCLRFFSYFNIVIKIDFITLIWIPIFLWHLFFFLLLQTFPSFTSIVFTLLCLSGKQSFYKLTFYSFTLVYLQYIHHSRNASDATHKTRKFISFDVI